MPTLPTTDMHSSLKAKTYKLFTKVNKLFIESVKIAISFNHGNILVFAKFFNCFVKLLFYSHEYQCNGVCRLYLFIYISNGKHPPYRPYNYFINKIG